MKTRVILIVFGLLTLGACHQQAQGPVLFATKGPVPFWVSDHQRWDEKKNSKADRGNYSKDWDIENNFSPLSFAQGLGVDGMNSARLDIDHFTMKPALNVSKEEFSIMRGYLKEGVCAVAVANAHPVFLGGKKESFRTETYWEEYVSGKKGNYKLSVRYYCMAEGIHKGGN